MSDALSTTLRFWYAQWLLLIRRNASAKRILEALTRESPRHQQAWSSLGFLLADIREYDAAAQAFERALALDPHDGASQFNLGYVVQQQGRHEDALSFFERAVGIDPNSDRAWYGAGLSLVQLGRLEEAALRFQEAARLQPFNPYAGYQLASVYHALGEPGKVRSEYDRVKGFDPKVAERIRREFGPSGR